MNGVGCCRMDYIRKYDIELEKEQYYAGEVLRGWVVIENAENLRITGGLSSPFHHLPEPTK